MADLDELKRRGAERDAADADVAAGKSGRERRAARDMARASTTRLGIVYGGACAFALGSAAVVISAATLVVPWFFDSAKHQHAPGAGMYIKALASLLMPIPVLWLARRLAVHIGARNEPEVYAWAAGLPFPLAGLPELLAGAPRRALRVLITPAAVSHLTEMRLAAAGLDDRFTATVHEGALLLVDPNVTRMRDDAGPTDGATNYQALRSLRRIVDELLVPLHRAYPLASVTASASK